MKCSMCKKGLFPKEAKLIYTKDKKLTVCAKCLDGWWKTSSVERKMNEIQSPKQT